MSFVGQALFMHKVFIHTVTMRIPLVISLVLLSTVINAFVPHRVQQPLSIKPVFSSTIVKSPFKTSHNNVNLSNTARKAEVAYPVDGSE